ncbi:MAG: hypothetical protein ACYDHH_12110 [Solirubrobacteraceae bacterium]
MSFIASYRRASRTFSLAPRSVPTSVSTGAIFALVAVVAGAGAPRSSVKIMAAGVAFCALVAVARQTWGAPAVVAPPFVVFSSGTSRILAVAAMGVLAVIYWDTLGRPRISPVALLCGGIFSSWTLATTWYHSVGGAGADGVLANTVQLRHAAYIFLLPLPAIVFGTCLARSKAARKSLIWGCLPLAIFAYAELAGLHNPLPGLEGELQQIVRTSIAAGSTRSQSTFGSPLIAGDCLAALGALALYSRARFSALIALVYGGAALTTVSRSALLGLAAAMLCGLVISGQRSRRALQMLGIVVAAVLLSIAIPSLNSSVTNRITSLSVTDGNLYSQQLVRYFGVNQLSHDLHTDPTSLMFGKGAAASRAILAAREDVPGYDIFDNAYISTIYDFGIVPGAVIALLVVSGLCTSSIESLRLGLPALACTAVVMYFADGNYWASISLLGWASLGMCLAPQAATRPNEPPGSPESGRAILDFHSRGRPRPRAQSSLSLLAPRVGGRDVDRDPT